MEMNTLEYHYMSIHVWSGHDGSIRRKVEHFCIIIDNRPRTPFPISCQGYSNSLSNEYDEVKNGFLSITLHIQHSIFFSYKV